MGAGKYNTGAQITHTILGSAGFGGGGGGRSYHRHFCAVFLGSRDSPVSPETGGRDHVNEHVTKHEPRLASFAEVAI